MLTLKEISDTMSDLENQALEGFQGCAQAFDTFNQGAAKVVQQLLAEIGDLRSENNGLRIRLHHLNKIVDEAEVDSSLVGGTDAD